MTYLNDEDELIWENAGHWLPPLDFEAEEAGGILEPLEPASRRARGPVARRIYTTGRGDLDRDVTEMIGTLASGLSTDKPASSADLELTREMLTSTLRLVLQRANRAELKMVNAALKEFA